MRSDPRPVRSDPLVIGGVGGSGTRAVARIVRRTGRFMGGRVNTSEDALDIAEFDWRWGLRYLRDGATEAMRAEFEVALAAHLAELPSPDAPWGWKHPHSYLVLPFLAERFAGLRFVLVARDGVDIALGRNHNQVRHYGDVALGPGDPDDPVRRIAFWAWAVERARANMAALGPERALTVRLEDLCARPEDEVRRVVAFAGGDAAGPLPVDEVARPESLGRGRRADPDLVARLDAAAEGALRRLGYAGAVA